MGPKRIKVKVPLVHTDIGQAIIDAVEKHRDWEMPIWLKRIYDELKKQRGREGLASYWNRVGNPDRAKVTKDS